MLQEAPQLGYLKKILVESIIRVPVTINGQSAFLTESEIDIRLWKLLHKRFLLFTISAALDEGSKKEILALMAQKAKLYRLVLLNSKL